MDSTGTVETKVSKLGAATCVIVGLVFIQIVVLHFLTMPVQFEPSTNLLKNALNPFFTFIFWAFTITSLLTILFFLGLRQLLIETRPVHSLLATVAGVVSLVLFALSSLIYATTMPTLAAAYASGSDLDLQRSIVFQASAFDNLALGIISVASLFFAVSVFLWGRAMDKRFGKFSLFTLALGLYSLGTLLPFSAGSILPWLSLLIVIGVWLVSLNFKMIMMTNTP